MGFGIPGLLSMLSFTLPGHLRAFPTQRNFRMTFLHYPQARQVPPRILEPCAVEVLEELRARKIKYVPIQS